MTKFLTFLTCFLLALGASKQQDSDSESRILSDLLLNYDLNNLPPTGAKIPTIVTINFYLRYFQKMESTMEQNEMELTFRQQWTDSRLAYNDSNVSYISIRDHKKIWVPDLFFSNSKSGFFHDLMEPNILLRVYPNGDVLYSSRVTIVGRCSSDWRYYPFSKMNCPLIIASYGSTTDDIVLRWKDKEPIQVSVSIRRAHSLKLENVSTDTCTSRTNTGEYSCLKGTFVFKLNFGPFFGTLFLPSMVSVLLSCLSFWLDRKHGPSMRLTLLVFCLCLSLLAWLMTLYQSPVSYVTNASHVWSGISFLFTLGALLQFYLSSAVTCRRSSCAGGQGSSLEAAVLHTEILKPMIKEEGEEDEKLEKPTPGNTITFTTSPLRHLLADKRNKADRIARILYPSVYLVFNIIYWAVYNEKAEED